MLHFVSTRPVTAIALALLLTLAPFTSALASHKEERTLLSLTKISLTEAVAKAESRHQGKAIKAELEEGAYGRPRYDVKVITETNRYEVTIDAQTGEVINSMEDRD